ncbi:cell division protein ZapC [Vibrio sp. SCSIO 43136]|nr:cell division protein ZapC [Vibrio sp. SCSIO 43136]
MLKPDNSWNWSFDSKEQALKLNMEFNGKNYGYSPKIPSRMLVDEAFTADEFTVEDAANFDEFQDAISTLNIHPHHQDELALVCLCVQRFHKPSQPKSWYFDYQGEGYTPSVGEFVCLKNGYNQSHGLFIVVEAGDSASVCVSADLNGFVLNDSKVLAFGQNIKVMHDRMVKADFASEFLPVAMVG